MPTTPSDHVHADRLVTLAAPPRMVRACDMASNISNAQLDAARKVIDAEVQKARASCGPHGGGPSN